MGTIKLADIARQNKVDPKTARRKFRKLYMDKKRNSSLPKPVDRWEFDSKDKKAVERLIAN